MAVAIKPKIRWWVYVGEGAERERIPHTAKMRGPWGYDATCSCGWDSETGGATYTTVKWAIYFHKLLDHLKGVTP